MEPCSLERRAGFEHLWREESQSQSLSSLKSCRPHLGCKNSKSSVWVGMPTLSRSPCSPGKLIWRIVWICCWQRCLWTVLDCVFLQEQLTRYLDRQVHIIVSVEIARKTQMRRRSHGVEEGKAELCQASIRYGWKPHKTTLQGGPSVLAVCSLLQPILVLNSLYVTSSLPVWAWPSAVISL